MPHLIITGAPALATVDEVEPMSETELTARLNSFSMHLRVFILPPWPEIYTTDAKRDHDIEHFVAVYRSIFAKYLRCG